MTEAQSLAARLAANEAVIKAWSSTRFGQPDVIEPEAVDLSEIEVRTDAWGRPAVRLHGAIGAAMATYDALVSLPHDPAADPALRSRRSRRAPRASRSSSSRSWSG
jgi:holo-[acyl-carrier protein] synthase